MPKQPLRLLAVAAAAFALSASTAPSASAEPSPPGCDRGAFCAYDLGVQEGRLLLETKGDWRGSVGDVGSIFNNGVPFPGRDHVQVDYHWPSGTRDSVCLHYNPGPGDYQRTLIPDDAIVTKVIWRGEC